MRSSRSHLSDSTFDEKRRALTVVVVASPIPTHPDNSMLRATVDSVCEHVPEHLIREIVISNDAFKDRASGLVDKRSYSEYLEKTSKWELPVPMRFITHATHQHISGQLSSLRSEIQTPFVLIVQHDLFFVKPIPMESLLSVMRNEPYVRHIRFNRRENLALGWDANVRGFLGRKSRIGSFREFSWRTPTGDVSLIKTLAWSDNNFLTSTAYLGDVIIPLTRGLKCSPEQVINPVNSHDTHDIFGTYIFGKIAETAAIKHLDGRRSGLPNSARRTSKWYPMRLRRFIKRIRKLLSRGERILKSMPYAALGRLRFRRIARELRAEND